MGRADTGNWVRKYVEDSVFVYLVGGALLLQKAASYAALLNKSKPESY